MISNRDLDDQWHHVAACRRQGALELFCDGELVAQGKYAKTTGAITTDLRTLGQDRKTLLKNQKSELHENFQGALDEFYIYSRALNRTEIKKLSERHFPVEIKSIASPIKYSGTQYFGRCAVRNEDNTSQDKVKKGASP